MRFTTPPEISALGLPVPVQYLTMNDWTRRFESDDFPDIVQLYGAAGVADRLECKYEATDHTYDRSKRELTYAWMEQWLRGRAAAPAPSEPETMPTLPPEELLQLRLPDVRDDDFSGISDFYRRQRQFRAPQFSAKTEFTAWREEMKSALRELLGEAAALPREAARPRGQTGLVGELRIERVSYPSEGPACLPTVVLFRSDARGPLPVVIMASAGGNEALLHEDGPDSARQFAREGSLVVLPDVRFTGQLSFAALAGKFDPAFRRFQPAFLPDFAQSKESLAPGLQRAWERNAILWGRPLPAMACTDLRAVLDALATRADADLQRVRLVTRDSGSLAIAAIFAAAIDVRITSLDVDLAGACFANRKLPAVPFVLWHGDVLQWVALLAEQTTVTLRHVPAEAGALAWVENIFTLMGNRNRLTIAGAGRTGRHPKPHGRSAGGVVRR